MAGVEKGERFYGYFPLASHLRVRPERVTDRGFADGAPHRQPLVSAYNHYVRVSADPAYQPAHEDHQALLRPLFITSFMLADFLQDKRFFGARRVVFSSASSKTAYGTAFCLESHGEIERVALTSAANLAFTEGLGCYRRTVEYGALESIASDVPTLYVDFSGSDALRARIHHHFGAALVYDCFVGSAHNTQFLRDAALPGPKPEFFFAPVQIRKRNADWGHAEFNRRSNEAQQAFTRRVDDAQRPWMRITQHRGLEAARPLIEALVAGKADPREGHIIVLE